MINKNYYNHELFTEACSRLMRVAAYVDPLVNRYIIQVKSEDICKDNEIVDEAIALTMDLLYSEEYNIDIKNEDGVVKFKYEINE